MKRLVENFKKNKVVWLLVTLIFISGVFLRTYRHHDLLRFNADQGRDAEIVSGVIDGGAPLPLLGPKAGGTTFKLGPIFYYFEILSAKIFGNYPDKMAYPDLFAGILAIPLLYFFLRKYFNLQISLTLAAIFSLSEFAIRWARFAWNPNAVPFWILLTLYALHEIVSEKKNNKLLWAIIAGLAVGVDVQLHTLLMLNLPLTITIVFGYLLYKKKKTWRYYFVILALALFLNIPQFYNEYLTGGENTQAFFAGIQKKQSSQGSIWDNIVMGNSALAQIVPNVITGYEISDDFRVDFNKKHPGDAIVVILGALFTLGGLCFGVRYFRKEKDLERKAFLLIIGLYSSIAYLFYIKLAFEISVRMYLVVFFVPFFLLGFWLMYLTEKMEKYKLMILSSIGVLIIAVNIYFIRAYLVEFDGYASANGSVNISTLGELEKFTDFVVSSHDNSKKVYISGDKKFFFINYLPMRYLLSKERIELILVGKKETTMLNQYYYLGRENKLEEVFSDADFAVGKHFEYGKFNISRMDKR